MFHADPDQIERGEVWLPAIPPPTTTTSTLVSAGEEKRLLGLNIFFTVLVEQHSSWGRRHIRPSNSGVLTPNMLRVVTRLSALRPEVETILLERLVC